MRFRCTTTVVIAVYVALMTAALCYMLPMKEVPPFVISDALYYPRVAQNVVAGYGVTFDRQTYTNGLHPLWGALLLLPALLAGGDHITMLRLTFLACGAFVVVGITSLHGLARQLRWLRAGTVLATALLFFPRADLWLSLLESGPAMGILLLTLYLCRRYELLTAESVWCTLLFGFLMAIVFLVRLDQVFIVLAMFVGAVYVRMRAGQLWRRTLRSILVSGLFALLIVLPYLIANFHFFGHIVPVSGRKKHVLAESATAVFSGMFESFFIVARQTGLPAWAVGLLVVTVVAALGLYAIRFAPRRGEDTPQITAGGVIPFFALGTVVRLVYLRIFVSDEASYVHWYWIPEYVLCCIIAGYLAARAAEAVQHLRARRALGVLGYA
ncbi:unnamed protein product, partial [marine sediment metagenome]